MHGFIYEMVQIILHIIRELFNGCQFVEMWDAQTAMNCVVHELPIQSAVLSKYCI